MKINDDFADDGSNMSLKVSQMQTSSSGSDYFSFEPWRLNSAPRLKIVVELTFDIQESYVVEI